MSADGGSGQVLLLLNAGGEPHRFPVDAGSLVVAETSQAGVLPEDPLLLPPHSWTILA